MIGKLISEKRVLICTFVALASGFFGSYLGGQISWLARTEQCRNQPEGLDHLCRAWQTPGALWKGSTAGAWTGTILGAFMAGAATRKPSRDATYRVSTENNHPFSKVKRSPPLDELTADEIATLRRILRSLLEPEKNPHSIGKTDSFTDQDPQKNSSTLSFTQFLDWADAVAKQSQRPPTLTRNKAREILIYLGFAESHIDTVWQNLNQGDRVKKSESGCVSLKNVNRPAQ